MTYAIQQFHATRYVTVAEARTIAAAFAAAGRIKRKSPELPVRIEQMNLSKSKNHERTTATEQRRRL